MLLVENVQIKILESFRIVSVRTCQIVTFSDLSNLPNIPRSGASVYYVGMMVLETGFVCVMEIFIMQKGLSISVFHHDFGIEISQVALTA